MGGYLQDFFVQILNLHFILIFYFCVNTPNLSLVDLHVHLVFILSNLYSVYT